MSDPADRNDAHGDPVGKSQLPLREAVAFSLQSISLRIGRMIVMLLGIAFAIAFLAVLLGTESIMRGVQELAARREGTQTGGADSFRRWWIAVALLIATVGITNAVLMSVTERIKEIGTLKCLGARGLHIVEIFLFETLLLGALGGALGGILGVLSTVALFRVRLGSDLWRIFGWGDAFGLVGISIVLSLLVSLVAAVIPVVIAARIEPAEAMRYEV